MRRFALTLLASLSVVALSACSGYGGSGLGGGDSNNYNALVFSTGADGPNGIFKVAPAPNTTPLIVSVFGSKSSFAVTQFNTTATWAVTYAFAPTTYHNQNGSSSAPTDVACPAAPSPLPGFANPSTALVVQAVGTGAWVTYTPGTTFQTIGIIPVAAAAGFTTPAASGYCLNVVATSPNGTQGSVIVFVGNA